MIELPIDSHLPAIVAALDRSRAAVIVAEPGAGKTTRVPPALAAAGAAILLQPRRVAARAIARRIADERGWTVGREVGWHVRFERRFSPDTRLLVATEGILTARLQQDPLLSSFRTLILDEFHERSLHADVGLALAKQAWLARDDLRIAIMSATLDASAVADFLGGCPIISAQGRTYPIDISFSPGSPAETAIRDVIERTEGDVLCFQPGALEIQRTIDGLRNRLPSSIEVLPLHGGLDPGEQDRALRPGDRRRVVVATNIAETSVTVPGVTAVIDSGLQKVARYDAARGIDSLVTERITQDSADQRAGRAGRTAAGTVLRLWDARDRLRPHREAEVHRVDLASTALDIIAWGGDPGTLEWFEAPRADAIESAVRLLDRLGATAGGAITDLGRRMQALPLHPRLARILIAGGGHRDFARACAVLSERLFLPPRRASTTSDLLSALDDWARVPPHVQRIGDEIARAGAHAVGQKGSRERGHVPEVGEEEFRRALLTGYPDRVAQRREPGSPRVRLASGAGAVIGADSGVKEGAFLLAIDVVGAPRDDDPDGRVRLASRIEREWLEPTSIEIVHRVDDNGVVRADEVHRYDALVLAARPVAPDADVAAKLLASEYFKRAIPESDQRLERRLAFAGIDVDFDDLVRRAAYGARNIQQIDPGALLGRDVAAVLAREAPETIQVPSGRTVRLEYTTDGGISASVKLQELFGLADTPRIGWRKTPIVFSLLAPNGRPVQITGDLRSFWNRTYPEVRKELRGRYPRHPWPEDPWNATPTHRTSRKMRD